MMADPRRVAVIHAANDPSMDQVIAGIGDFRRLHPGWILRQQYQVPHTSAEVAEFLAWQPDGILSAVSLPAVLKQAQIPCVAMRGHHAAHAVVIDERTVGDLAAETLAGLGAVSLMYNRFADESEGAVGWVENRRGGFIDGLIRRGLRGKPLTWLSSGKSLDDDARHVMAQVRTMPRPCAVFTGNDHFAVLLLEFVLAAGLRVPADVAILGADDTPRAANALVPISSVQVPHREVGKRAAALLADLMDGGHHPPRVEMIAPVGVTTRASTDAVGIRDPEVAAVLQFIRAHAGDPFTVGDAVQAAQLSRRSIEQRFRSVLGRSILDEIHRVRIERSQAMLREGQRSMTEIALACGFNESPYFTVVFRKLVGETPSAWRRRQASPRSG